MLHALMLLVCTYELWLNVSRRTGKGINGKHGPMRIENGKLLQYRSTHCLNIIVVESYLPTDFLVLCLCGQY